VIQYSALECLHVGATVPVCSAVYSFYYCGVAAPCSARSLRACRIEDEKLGKFTHKSCETEDLAIDLPNCSEHAFFKLQLHSSRRDQFNEHHIGTFLQINKLGTHS
jgi:hypothetical protein